MTCDYLVTGGAGFIGSNICKTLVEQGKRVRVIDNFSTGKKANLHDIADLVEIHVGDIRERETVQRAVKGIRYVLHQAALPSVPRSMKDPIASHQVNTTGTLNVLNESVHAGVERFVFASSSSVYGDQPVLPKSENQMPNPQSPYALTKSIGEQYCQLFSELHGLPCICLRYFNVFGPHQDPQSDYAAVIPAFVKAHLIGKQPIIFGDGLQTRDFTYVNNVVAANLAACHNAKTSFAVVNIGAGQKTSVNELCYIIKTMTGSKQEPVHKPPRKGDVRDSLADIQQARKILGYRVDVSLSDGLDDTVKWYRKTFH